MDEHNGIVVDVDHPGLRRDLRLSLYRAYLYLIMWVETAPRRYDEKRRARLRSLAFHPLAEILDTWSARA